VKRRNNAQKQLFDTLVPVIKQRRAERERASLLGKSAPVHVRLKPIEALFLLEIGADGENLQNDCIQYILSSSASKTPRTPEGVAHELMALWFASVHPTSVVGLRQHDPPITGNLILTCLCRKDGRLRHRRPLSSPGVPGAFT